MFESERRPAWAVMEALGAIDGLAGGLAGGLDERACESLARRLTYFLLRPVGAAEVRALAAGDGQWRAVELESNARGLTAVGCMETMQAAMEERFRAGVWCRPAPVLVRFGELAQTRAWRDGDGPDLIEFYMLMERAGGARAGREDLFREFPIVEMGHAVFLLDGEKSECGQSLRIARIMGWPESCPGDLEALIELVLESAAVILGLPFELCRPGVGLEEMLTHSMRPSAYWGLEQRIGGLVGALGWLWHAGGRRKGKAMMKAGQESVRRDEDVAAWVKRWA